MPLFKPKKKYLLKKYFFGGNKCDIYKYFCPYTYPWTPAEGKGFAGVQKFQPLPLPQRTPAPNPWGSATPQQYLCPTIK